MGFVIAAVILSAAWIYAVGLKPADKTSSVVSSESGDLSSEVLPTEGVVLPIKWGDLGARLMEAGVIDEEKFEKLYAGRGGLTEETRGLLYGKNGEIVMTPENADVLLNLFWAFGLGNKNPILENGPMRDSRYGGDAGRFASTGGWILAKGDAMDHYGRYAFVSLTPAQQRLVEQASQNIYRPCCNNPTYFPDCNHGMAMLGLLELMAAEGMSEEEMYAVALRANSYWFPDTYLTIARYLASKGIDWGEADAKEILGADYSSASGYQRILVEIQPVDGGGGGGCGV